MEDLSLEKEKLTNPRKVKISQEMGDEEFNKTIDRIVKEATQYEEDTHEHLPEEVEEEEAEEEIQPAQQEGKASDPR